MTTKSNVTDVQTPDREIVISRVFDAPRELVWDAMTDPKKVIRWWGPTGFTTTIEEMDLRPGGVWKHVMHGPDGTNYPNKSVFKEIVKPERIVYSHGGGREGARGVSFVATWTFEQVDESRTKLTIHQVFPSSEERDRIVKEYGAIEGGKQTLGRLAEFLVNPGAVGTVSGRESVITRVFDAPRELVFRAWTDPEHLIHWWGPKGFTNTFQEVNIQPGGVWRFIMHGPDGIDYQNKITFREIVAPELISYIHGDDNDPAQFETVVTFAEEPGGKTKLTMRATFPSAEYLERVVKEHNALESGKQTIERLAVEVAKMEEEFVIARVFDAPRELVWNAWTDPEHLKHWWGPKGFAWGSCTIDLRPGGVFHYSMRAPNGFEMWGKFVYREITPPERMVFIVSFSDEKGGTARHPMSQTWPLEVLNILTLSEHGCKTTLTMRGIPVNATEEERKTFKGGHPGMQQGFKGTMDQLDEYLSKNQPGR